MEHLFNKVEELQARNLIKEESLRQSCFLKNFAKFIKTAFFNRTPLVALRETLTEAFLHYAGTNNNNVFERINMMFGL